jgi:hypothetical protein
VTPNQALQQTAGMIRFWDFKLCGAPPLLSYVVMRQTMI